MDELDLQDASAAVRAAVALIRQGQSFSAIRLLQSALATEEGWQARFTLGVAQHRLGRLADALQSFSDAVAAAPEEPQVRCARAALLFAVGRLDEAESDLLAALATQPAMALAWCNLAIAREARGDAAAAERHYDRAIALEPKLFPARLNRGLLKLARADASGALEDFDALLPSASAAVQVNRTRALFALHRDADALEAARAALAAEPRNARAWLDAAHACASLGNEAACRETLEAAGKALGRPLASAPEWSSRRASLDPDSLYVARAIDRQAVCDWRDRDRLCEVLRRSAREGTAARLLEPVMLTDCLALPLAPSELRALADSVAAGLRSDFPAQRSEVRAASGSRIRIGVLSPEYRVHTGGFVLRRLFRHRDASRFEYFAYALNPDDGSAMRRELHGLADAFIDVSTWSPEDIAGRMRRDRIDVLLDRTGYFAGARPEALALRPAPVAVSYLGQPSSLGAGMVDYRLSDVWTTPPETQEQWPERLLLLPGSHAVFEPDHEAPKPRSREDFDLPEDAVVLCHLDQSHKIEPQVFGAWMRVLAAAPDALLWLGDGGEAARANLRREAQARGVAPSRLRFAPVRAYPGYLECLPTADVYLNPFQYSSRSIAYAALRAGVPVLMRPGESMASRLALPFLKTLGLDEFVAASEDEYVGIATRLAQDRQALRGARERVRAAASAPLFDPAEQVRLVERALLRVVERHRAGLAPEMQLIE